MGRRQGGTERTHKHGITFWEARHAFDDPAGLDIYDESHSAIGEKRFIRLGLTPIGLLFVSYTMRNSRAHIIHARKAGKTLETEYEKHRGQED
jgi:uncharacterized DUF497 family protein